MHKETRGCLEMHEPDTQISASKTITRVWFAANAITYRISIYPRKNIPILGSAQLAHLVPVAA